jgi:ankyrin repeat protein
LGEYLDEHPDLDLISLTDTQNNTVLHQLAYEGQLDIMRLFVKRAKQFLLRKNGHKKRLYEKDENQEMTAWMNAQNSEGFTALLYASYNGHMDIIRYLV